MKQVFKGKKLTLSKVVASILAVYERSDKSFRNDWYKEANLFASHLSVMHNVPLSVACGVIAALSPIKSWHENKLIADNFLATGKAKHTKLFQGRCNI